ncbi:hypothetical protein H0H93_005478 [Arthromyces matolae]|nr:hypothetical protein H0H93_005478 [Arthromyces matolae]
MVSQRLREKAKLDDYLSLTQDVLARKKDKDWSEYALELTSRLLQINPEFYTIWNYRRNIFLNGIFPQSSPEDINNHITLELTNTMAALKGHPKIYWIWNHRRWSLENTPRGPEGPSELDSDGWRKANWDRELYVVEKLLDADPRNFHAWNYRRYVLASMPVPRSDKSELAYTTRKIESNISNFSAWHQRSKVLQLSNDNHSQEEGQFDLLRNAMYTDPNDQSVWMYHRWLIGTGEDKGRLESEIIAIQELLDEQPDRCMESIVNYKRLLLKKYPNEVDAEKILVDCKGLLQQLGELDPSRHRRGSTPPATQQQQQPLSSSSTNASPSQIDSLFQHLNVDRQQQSSGHMSDNYAGSASVSSLLSLTDEPISSSASNASGTNVDRQNALLTLLGGAANRGVPAPAQSAPAPASAPVLPIPVQPQQIPTPPGSSQPSVSGTEPSHNEAPGKFLLEQLMSGNASRSTYVDSQPPHTEPSPPYAPSIREAEYRSYNQPEVAPEAAQRAQAIPQAAPPPPPPPQQHAPVISSQSQHQQVPQQPSPQQQTPSPRKSMFEFVSPFDHLSTATSIKKKPVPHQPSSVTSGNEDAGSWAVPDSKRHSVENLLEQLSRGQVQPQQSLNTTYEAFDFSQPEPLASRVPPPPLPPKPVATRPASPPLRSSPPPKSHAQRSQGRISEAPGNQSNVGGAFQQGGNRRDKEGSPVPRGNGRGKGLVQSKLPKNFSSPPPSSQTILFDVSKPMAEIQASMEEVKSTAIALVKQDSNFLPGSTIGATHWVAYTMTRGRVRVISRSSGFRTLLQLDPAIFALNSSIIDMAVHKDRLAAVTSQGGFIVWQLPENITDDAPGEILLCIEPSDNDGIHAVKWHPKDPNILAVATANKLYLVDLATLHSHYHGQPITLQSLNHISQTFTVSSRLVSFDFDIIHYALATITVESTLTIWNMHEHLPFSTHTIRGEDVPTSLTLVDGGIVIGRKNNTIFQLLSHTTKQVLSTIKFVNTLQDDNEMFGHACYDPKIQTLWVANNRRESIIAIRISLESSYINGEEAIRGGFDQIVEFSGPKPSVHFVILTAESDLNGKEANAACLAAKIPLGDLALLAFNVHSSGVDQILVRKEWFESALMTTPSKLPVDDSPPPQGPIVEVRNQRQVPQIASAPRPPQNPQPRPRSPVSEDGEFNQDDQKSKGKGSKSVNWKEKEDQVKEKAVRTEGVNVNESSQALIREIKRTEESLHSRIGRLIGKEMDKQNQRMDDARAHEQAEDFARQEKILKLISTELTRNTTRVVEMAVKNEVQNSVLPSLEHITRNEVKAALDEQIGRGLVDFISQNLPNELEKLLFRADISAHVAHIISTTLTPLLSNHIHDTMSKTVIPMYNQNLNRIHQELSQELRHEIHGLKAELMTWQRDLFRNQETSIRELEHTVRSLSDHVKFLGINAAAPHHNLQQQAQTRQSPNANVPSVQSGLNQLHARQQQNPPIPPPPPAGYGHKLVPLQQPLPPQQPPQVTLPPAPVHQSWYSPPIAAPQASHPATIPQPPPQAQPPVLGPQQPQHPEPIGTPDTSDTWESIFLPAVLSEDLRDLQRLLSRTNADVVMPLDRPGPLSQPVILTAMHRLAAIVCATPPNDESFKSAMWWLQRGIKVLDPKEQIVMDYLPNVVPGIYTHLNMTKQRLGLPGGPPTLEKARSSVNDALDMLRRKGLQGYEGMEVTKK